MFVAPFDFFRFHLLASVAAPSFQCCVYNINCVNNQHLDALKPRVCILAVVILFFLEPEVTIFGRDGGAEQTLSYQLTLALAWLAIRANCDINRDANFG